MTDLLVRDERAATEAPVLPQHGSEGGGTPQLKALRTGPADPRLTSRRVKRNRLLWLLSLLLLALLIVYLTGGHGRS